MEKVQQGSKVPAFRAPATGGADVNSGDFLGAPLVLYFYPKDNTPGCIWESKDFRDRHGEFTRRRAALFGVSRDNLKSHENFKSKYDIPFELISDPEENLCELFDVIKTKAMYGRTFLGVQRSTFLIDEEGILRREWRKVRVKGHVNDVLAALDAL